MKLRQLTIFSFVFLVSVEVLSFERAVVLIPIPVIPTIVVSVIPMLMLALASILLLVLLLGRVSFSEKKTTQTIRLHSKHFDKADDLNRPPKQTQGESRVAA